MTALPLKEGAIYCVALTPYQYVAKRVQNHVEVAWLLLPLNTHSPLLAAPTAYVNHDNRIGTGSGLTILTTDDLDFTGRYQHGHSNGTSQETSNGI